MRRLQAREDSHRLQVRLTQRSVDTPSRSAQNRNANVGTFAGRGGRQAARAHWHRIASSDVADYGIRARLHTYTPLTHKTHAKIDRYTSHSARAVTSPITAYE